MCAVIGVCLRGVSEDDLSLVRNLFNESMIRGKHATGVTYFNGEQLVTIKEPIPADKFIEKHDPADWIYKHDMGSSIENLPCIAFVGHTRYSTSDLHTNQPFVGCMEEQQVAVAGQIRSQLCHHRVACGSERLGLAPPLLTRCQLGFPGLC